MGYNGHCRSCRQLNHFIKRSIDTTRITTDQSRCYPSVRQGKLLPLPDRHTHTIICLPTAMGLEYIKEGYHLQVRDVDGSILLNCKGKFVPVLN